MRILLFGVARDIVGSSSLELSKGNGAGLDTVGDLKRRLTEEYPALKELSSLAMAINQTYAREEDPLNESDEIALIPPVSGG